MRIDPRSTNRNRRACPPGRRDWRGQYVDKNLEDGWLEALNSFSALDLISICEGHSGHSRNSLRSFPHINLRVKEEHKLHVIPNWEALQSSIEAIIQEQMNSVDTHAEVELRRRTRTSPTGQIQRSDDFVIKLRSRMCRLTDIMDESEKTWFEAIIAFARRLDNLIAGQRYHR
jgi:hypothetical protein